MSKRLPLRKGVSIDVIPQESAHLTKEKAGSQLVRHFAIGECIGDGANSLCYRASSQSGVRGVLKEFYPQSIAGLTRDSKSHQLLSSSAYEPEHNLFQTGMGAFHGAYITLRSFTQRTDRSAANLASCIPHFELYQGCSPDGEPLGTVYAFIPVPAYKTFEQVCSEIHSDPYCTPHRNLVSLLKTLVELASCVVTLHSDRPSLVHRDIKPANFGFLTRDSKLLEQSLTFFDADTICTVENWRTAWESGDAVYTPGYFDPDALRNEKMLIASYQDIYAIGATVFHALVANQPPEMQHSNPESCKTYLADAVKNAPLLTACRAYLPPRFKYQLIEFLLKCFRLHEHSFKSALQVKKELDDLLSAAASSKSKNGKRDLAGVEKKLDNPNARLAMQYHLYSHPLYEYSREQDVNVLLLGFGYYGQAFMDSCLQAGQLLDQALHITVFSDDQDQLDRKIYLDERPALTQFFNVDDTQAPVVPAYGNITFQSHKLTFDRDGRPAVDDCINDLKDKPHYIFIALGDDELNIDAAEMCLDAFLNDSTSICFVCENEKALRSDLRYNRHLLPVFVNRSIKRSKEYQELERMAFNAHLLWEKQMNVDFAKAREAFEKPYNHSACLGNVLSLKAKLHGFGIELGKLSPIEAAAAFAAKVEKDPQVRQQTIWLEHRRWVAEKICDGFTAITDMQACAQAGDHRDKKNKRHTCLIPSDPKDNLAQNFYKDGAIIQKRWNETGYLDGLDPLEKMSVLLHRAYYAKAKAGEEERWAQICGICDLIEQRLQDQLPAHQAWDEYYTCIKDVFNRHLHRVNQLEDFRSAFLAHLPAEDPATNFIKSQLASFDNLFAPIIKSMQYENFKDEDVRMVDQIPFLLTYDAYDGLIIPYTLGSNSLIFQNVAAALVINPENIVYLYHADDLSNKDDIQIKELCASLSFLASFIRRKNLRAKIHFHFTFTTTEDAECLAKALTEQLTEAGAGLNISIFPTCVKDRDAAVAHFHTLVNQGVHRRFALENNDSPLSCMLQGARVHQKRRHYRFNPVQMTFAEPDECRIFTHIAKKPRLSAADILSIRKSTAVSFDYPEFRKDYTDLWKKSREGFGHPWKQLCKLLRDHLEIQSLIASFSLQTLSDSPQELTYSVPKECYPAVSKILAAMVDAGLIKPESHLELNTSQSCRVILWDRSDNAEKFNQLFADTSRLRVKQDVEIRADKFSLKVFHNTLLVRDLSLKGVKEKAAVQNLLDYLQQQEYLQCYSINTDQRYTFSFSTYGVKDLLTTEGKALEIYIYHKLKASDFDDVVTSYEVLWEGTAVRSEFDAIATKGFCSFFIECKARQDLSQEFYFKLISLAEHFGVNAKAILIADTQENRYQTDANTMQRTRGRLLDVITISKYADILNIDKTLMAILGNRYNPT